MHRAYHYLGLSAYRQMQKGNVILMARSPLLHSQIVKSTGIVVPKRKFLFCLLDSPEPESWVKSGYLDRLITFFLKKKYALLSFRVDEKDSAYMLEASPVYDLWLNVKVKSKSDFASERFKEVFQSYVDSMIPLTKYSGNFKIPELIVARDVPFSQICLEGVVN